MTTHSRLRPAGLSYATLPPIEDPPRVGDPTPWGWADRVDPWRACTRDGCGGGHLTPPEVTWVSTPSHGGLWIPPKLREQIPDFVVEASWLKRADWWEEDVDVAWPIYLLSLGCVHDQELAVRLLSNPNWSAHRVWERARAWLEGERA